MHLLCAVAAAAAATAMLMPLPLLLPLPPLPPLQAPNRCRCYGQLINHPCSAPALVAQASSGAMCWPR